VTDADGREDAVRGGRDRGATATDGDDDGGDDPPALALSGVTRAFGGERAVEDLSLTVHEGELLTVLGPSGCGKTTTLRLLAGLERPDAGEIRVAGDPVAGPDRFRPPEDRDVGLVFQEFALFPHLTVGENVAFGIDDWSRERRAARVEELLDLVGLADYRSASPEDLSGGQRQRVALARSLAPEPELLLLDEPFSNLDVGLREEVRGEVRSIIKETGVTAVSVTHDQEEALSLGDRVAVMRAGGLEQVGSPERVFAHPESRFVAEFLGQAGFVAGRVEDGVVDTAVGAVHADELQGLTDAYEGAPVDVMVRPDDLRATVATDAGGNGRVRSREYVGPAFVYAVELDSGEVVHCRDNHAHALELDSRVRVDVVADHPLAWFPTGDR
jgi:iron(III) transport system ATP-binding protein